MKSEHDFRSPAKLNIRLEILSKRKDGYHDLRLLNTPISLCDHLKVHLVEKGIRVTAHDDPSVPSGEENIAHHACKEILAYSNKNIGVEIDIFKKIPAAAGLGGGSSNAATVLIALNQMLKIGLSKEKLMRIGLKLGSDVPFFLFGGAAIVAGIGEKLHRVKTVPKFHALLVVPRLEVSTAWAYREYRGASKHPLEELPTSYRTKKALCQVMLNNLESVTQKRYPVVQKIKQTLLHHKAIAAQMSGSGPSVFGIYASDIAAKAAYEQFRNKYANWRCYLVENL